MSMALLENKSGKFIKADLTSGKDALSSVQLPENLRAWVTDPTGEDSYPIVTYTWMLLYKKYQNPKTADALKSVVKYGLTQGQSFSSDLGYIPLPANVVDDDMKALDQIS